MIGPEQKYGPFPGFVKRKEEKSPSFFPGAGIHWTGEGAEKRGGRAVSELWHMEGGGTLYLREEGPRVHLESARPDDGRGLYKA